MKKEKTTEVIVCDYCGEEDPLYKCEICGKDFCEGCEQEKHLDDYRFCRTELCEKCHSDVWDEFKKIIKKLKEKQKE